MNVPNATGKSSAGSITLEADAGRRPWVVLAVLVAATVLVLRQQGRSWWCACEGLNLWASDIWSRHCSQHLVDPYAATHVLHGMVLYGLVVAALPRLAMARRWLAVLGLECVWELLENSRFLIERYRTATIALGYEGDSIVNSLGDIACCAGGLLLARRLGLRRSILFYLAVELTLLVWVRDNLTLNVLMLVCPIEAIKSWQAGH